jgi:hypothetical protein
LIKLLIKLAIVAIVANATWRIGSAYVAHYKFTDSVQQTTLFRGQRTDDQLRARVFEIASDFDIPVTEEAVSLRTEDHHTKVDGSYVREIEVFPGYKYAWPFEFHTDTLSGVL